MIHKVIMKRCGECNAPFLVRTLIKWQPDGTINVFFKKDMRMVFTHADMYKNLLTSLEEMFGISLSRLFIETERNMAIFLFDDLSRYIPGIHLARNSRTVSRLVLNFFHTLAYMFGFGRSMSTEFITGKRFVAYEKNPYNFDSFAAQIMGALESVYGKPYEHQWMNIGPAEYLFTASEAIEKPALTERMKMEVPCLIPGEYKHVRCSRCGAPRSLTENLTWFEEDGLLIERSTGVRMICFPAYSMTTVFRELAKELGDDVYELLVQSQKKWVVDNFVELMADTAGNDRSDTEIRNLFERQLDKFPLYGMGLPAECTLQGRGLTVKVINPFDVYLIAGYISGLYEIISGIKSEISWTQPREQVVVYSVSVKTDK